MLGKASDIHRKICCISKQKNICSAYPQSDGVRPESARKSSGSVKTSQAAWWIQSTQRWSVYSAPGGPIAPSSIPPVNGPAPTGAQGVPAPYSQPPTGSNVPGGPLPPPASSSLPPVNGPAPTGAIGGPAPYSPLPTNSNAPTDPKTQGGPVTPPASLTISIVNSPAPTGAQGGPTTYSQPPTGGNALGGPLPPLASSSLPPINGPAPTGIQGGPVTSSPPTGSNTPTDPKFQGGPVAPPASLNLNEVPSSSLPPVNGPAPTGTQGGPATSPPPTGSNAPTDPKIQGGPVTPPASLTVPLVNGPAPTGAQGGPTTYSSPLTNGTVAPAPNYSAGPAIPSVAPTIPHIFGPVLVQTGYNQFKTGFSAKYAINFAILLNECKNVRFEGLLFLGLDFQALVPQGNNTPSMSPAGSVVKGTGVPQEECTSTLPPKGPAPAATPSVFYSLLSKRFLTWLFEQIYVYVLNMNVLNIDLSSSEL
ncbi:uncharacterized protein LACBIDRAFT_324513 [Laccaria bicolor S238N-H82]|uniref:Predicted protein n=1 Tax=Laccaria bicolor (strain S238N-H82 / ATCC MYA-4686) TaxID=486041 RepID=B0D248_LACBS|nr:uncharacterized protein LACBIDRAFT_324513 [Laccaria bicolor S238N-H82]EDR11038.1 predicted protein [Laccaria bicolor S238N-H82]|eukprot:XP_001878339.1 predicted protein [Laccaria bicolor S238N-H82]